MFQENQIQGKTFYRKDDVFDPYISESEIITCFYDLFENFDPLARMGDFINAFTKKNPYLHIFRFSPLLENREFLIIVSKIYIVDYIFFSNEHQWGSPNFFNGYFSDKMGIPHKIETVLYNRHYWEDLEMYERRFAHLIINNPKILNSHIEKFYCYIPRNEVNFNDLSVKSFSENMRLPFQSSEKLDAFDVFEKLEDFQTFRYEEELKKLDAINEFEDLQNFKFF